MAPGTLERTLGRAKKVEGSATYVKPARNCKISPFSRSSVDKHVRNNFATIGAEIRLAKGTKPRRTLPWEAAGADHWDDDRERADREDAQRDRDAWFAQAAPPAKRQRITLSALGAAFIDEYLSKFIGLKGNAVGRASLYKAILDAARTRNLELGADKWTVQTIHIRLKNTASKKSTDHWTATDA